MNRPLLKYASPEDIETDFIKLAKYLTQTVEGDDVVDDAYKILWKYELIDDDGFWKGLL